MSIISISSNCFSRGADVAETVANSLGNAFVTREVIVAASKEFNVPESKLSDAIENPPSVFDRFSSSRASFITYYRTVLLRRLCEGKIVCHGLANHFFIRGISQALTVRVVADPNDRVVTAMERKGISRGEAERLLTKTDEIRRQWGMRIFGIDPQDPMLYDAVIHVGKMGMDGATDIICRLAGQQQFQTTPESQRVLEDQALAASVEVLTVDMQIDATVIAEKGDVTVLLKSTPRVRAGTSPDFHTHFADDLQRSLQRRCLFLPGVKTLKVELPKD